jgi:uncharacterized membrane protein YeaQ/YmgE (transglycosylase-associated protein family)
MEPPVINFVAAVGIGIVVGLIGGFVLRSRQPNAIWLAPVLGVVGAVLASVVTLILGDDRQYGWKEPILQVVLAIAGVAIAAFLGSRKSATTAPASRE